MLLISDNIVSDKVSTSILDSRRFLLAEDNALNREIIVELFAMFGAQVETAVDGKEAVAAFESRPTGYYDAIFMDIQMPLMDGYEAAQKIRCSQKLQAGTVPIVAMSGNVFAEVRLIKNRLSVLQSVFVCFKEVINSCRDSI